MNTPSPVSMNTPSPIPKAPPGAKYGWFSRAHKASGLPTHIYLDGKGVKVEVSSVTRGPEHGMGWDDVTYVGPVFCYIKSHTNKRLANTSI